MAAERYHIQPLAGHPRTDFSCGIGALDRYFREQAGQDLRRRLAAVYALVDGVTGTIAGYYTLSSVALLAQSLPEDLVRRLARYPVFPATLLGRLAVDLRYRAKGLGERLLLDALRRSLEASQQVAAMAVVVDAKDNAARAFYERYGFQPIRDDEHRLYLSMATISQLVPTTGQATSP